MAESKPISASEDEMTSLIECGICLLEMNNPKALPCLHSFCLECLKEVKHPEGIFICPLCQEKIVLPPEGVDGFRDNFFINQLKDKKVISSKGKINKLCVTCGAEGQEIAARCVECNGFICQQCVDFHQTFIPIKAHTIFRIDELQSGRIDMSKVIKEDNCQKHKEQILRWFCKTCNVPICIACTVMDHVRPDHDYITIESANEDQVKEIKSLMETCKGLTQRLMDTIVNTEEEESKLAKSVDNIKKQLGEEKKAYLEAIERSYKEMMDKLSQIQVEKAEKINVTRLDLQNKKSKLTNAVQVANQVITSGSKHDLASNYSTLCKTLADLQQVKTKGVKKGFSEIKFRPSQGNKIKSVDLGSVSTKSLNPKDGYGKWVLEREFGKKGDGKIKWGLGVTVNRNKDIYIAEYSGTVKIFDLNGNFKRVLQKNLKSSKEVAITHDSNTHYVTNGTKLVDVLDQKGEQVKQFPAISPDGKASDTDCSELGGLAVDNDGNILIGNISGQYYISKHKADGKHICSFKTNNRARSITVTHQGRIIVCADQDDTNAEILDDNGKLLHQITKPLIAKTWRPCRSCCSDDGIVYITSYGSRNEGGVYSFTEDGTYLGCVTTYVIQAEGIALIDDDRLVVVQYSGRPAKIFRYEET